MRHLKCDSGSAILEFITFVLIGQLMVFGGSIALATELSSKVELQMMAATAARTIALGREVQIQSNVSLVQPDCPARLVCVTLSRGEQKVAAVSYR